MSSKPAATQNKVVLYLRVSSQEQVSNFSLETQEDICKKEAERQGLRIATIFREEGKSAKTVSGRPELLNLLDFCKKIKKEIKAVIAYRLDRIARQTADYLTIRTRLAEYGITVISATEPTGDSPTEKLVETILAGFAQLDNDVRGERARNGMQARFKTGLISGKAPLGYLNHDGYVIKDPDAFDHVKQAWEMMLTGTKSLTDVTDFLNAKNVKISQDGNQYKVRRQTVARLMRNKFYCGLVVSRKYGNEVRGQHPAMVTEEQFYAVQSIIDGRGLGRFSISPVRMIDRPEFPLRRLVYCSFCGSPLTAATTKGKTAHYGYYFCQRRCKKPSSISPKLLDSYVERLLESISPTKDGMDQFMLALRKKYIARSSDTQNALDAKISQIETLKQMRQTVIEKNLAGIFSDAMLQEQLTILDEKLSDAYAAKARSDMKQYDLESISQFITTKLANLKATYENSNTNQRKVLLSSIYPSGIKWLYPGLSNSGISPLYQLILHADGTNVPLGEPGGSFAAQSFEFALCKSLFA